MRELTPETITDAVLDQMATTPDLRLKAIMASAVRHLHAFGREVNLRRVGADPTAIMKQSARAEPAPAGADG